MNASPLRPRARDAVPAARHRRRRAPSRRAPSRRAPSRASSFVAFPSRSPFVCFAALMALVALAALAGCRSTGASDELLNVSYDPTRELYEEYNAWFAARHEQQTGRRLRIEMSHGGSGRQARSVIDGLAADVVTLALEPDIQALVDHGAFVAPDWKQALPHNAAPYTSTQVFIVRRGNPRGIRTWDDLVREDVSVIVPNPRTSGGARWIYVAAWGWALRQPGGTEASARDFVARLYGNVPVLDSGARGSTTTFARNGIGDVLVSWENEAHLLTREMPDQGFEVVVPPASVLCEPPVAVVGRNADRRGTRELATAYLSALYEPEAQQIAARHGYRPRDPEVLAAHADRFPPLELFRVEDVLGSWDVVQREHFADGGVFDRIHVPGGRR